MPQGSARACVVTSRKMVNVEAMVLLNMTGAPFQVGDGPLSAVIVSKLPPSCGPKHSGRHTNHIHAVNCHRSVVTGRANTRNLRAEVLRQTQQCESRTTAPLQAARSQCHCSSGSGRSIRPGTVNSNASTRSPVLFGRNQSISCTEVPSHFPIVRTPT